MEFRVSNLEFGNQIGKFMCSYFGKFFQEIFKNYNFLESGFSKELRFVFLFPSEVNVFYGFSDSK